MKNLLLLLLAAPFILSYNNSNQNSKANQKKDTLAYKTHITTMNTQKITPCLWVEKDAKAVADYYLSIFQDGKLKEYHHYENTPEAVAISGQETFEIAIIQIAEMEFQILAAGPFFKFNESISFVINCKDQAEVDYNWEALTSNGGAEGQCGWCKDKYGLSWQVVPVEYYELISSEGPSVRAKVMKNTIRQKKIILSELKQS